MALCMQHIYTILYTSIIQFGKYNKSRYFLLNKINNKNNSPNKDPRLPVSDHAINAKSMAIKGNARRYFGFLKNGIVR